MEFLKTIWLIKVLVLAGFLCTTGINSRATEVDRVLYPPELNSILVLPQRFEYGVLDSGRFHLGPILIQLDEFQASFQNEGSLVNWSWQWSTPFFDQGKLVIKDQSRRTIWTHVLDSERIQTQQKAIKSKGNSSNTRMPIELIAVQKKYKLTLKDSELMRELIERGSFQFCLQTEEASSQVEMCTQPYELNKTDSETAKLTAISSPEIPFVEIDGQKVSKTGIFFVESTDNPMRFRALGRSGANFNLVVVRRAVSFMNLTTLADKKKLRIQAQGAEPLGSEKKVNSTDGFWETLVDLDRPRLYLTGEVGIPFQQEFYLAKDVTSYPEISIEPAAENEGYARSLKLKLLTQPEFQLKTSSPSSKVDSISNSTWSWEMKDLKIGPNRRLIQVDAYEQKYVGVFDFERWQSQEMQVYAHADVGTSIHYKYLLTRRWGTELSYQILSKRQLSERPLISSGFVSGNFTRGIKGRDQLVSGLIGLQNFFSGSFSSSSIAGGLELDKPSGNKFWGDRWNVNWKVPLVSLSAQKKTSGFGIVQGLAKWNLWGDTFASVGVESTSLTLTADEDQTQYSNTSILIGLSLIF